MKFHVLLLLEQKYRLKVPKTQYCLLLDWHNVIDLSSKIVLQTQYIGFVYYNESISFSIWHQRMFQILVFSNLQSQHISVKQQQLVVVLFMNKIAITTIGNSPKNDFYNQICFSIESICGLRFISLNSRLILQMFEACREHLQY